MQLSDKSGIMCDNCGVQCRHDFTYYSYDFRIAEATKGRSASLDYLFSTNPVFSLDICPLCFDKHTKAVVGNNAKPLKALFCDLSNKIITGMYYHVGVTKAEVRVSTKSVKSVERFVEFNIADSVYKQLVETAGTLRKVASTWITK